MAVTTATAYTEAVAMAIPHKLVTELLELPDEDRGALAALLWRSLEPDDGDELTGKEWEAVWAAEIDRRMREVAEGKVELVDGDQVDAEIRAMLDAPMP
jgi:putative addiction module component (TIGR02574 family)